MTTTPQDHSHSHDHPPANRGLRARVRAARDRLFRGAALTGAGIGGGYLLLEYAYSIKDPGARERFLARATAMLQNFQQSQTARSADCEDCGCWGFGYMLYRDVWEEALTEEERDALSHGRKKGTLLCLACVQKRLGRPLTSEDFDPKYPINWPIFAAMEIRDAEVRVERDMGGPMPRLEQMQKFYLRQEDPKGIRDVLDQALEGDESPGHGDPHYGWQLGSEHAAPDRNPVEVFNDLVRTTSLERSEWSSFEGGWKDALSKPRLEDA